ncbi:hypothetical protein N9N28_17305 [Rubripirellula amarantea]|nr:hypothetical protein [Rubripirellula amarantea]
MKNLTFLSTVLLAFNLGQSPCAFADDAVPARGSADDFLKTRSYFEGWGTNVAAIVSYDVAAKYSQHSDFADGTTEIRDSIHILRFDKSTRRHLRIRKSITTVSDNEGKESRTLELSSEGIVHNSAWHFGSSGKGLLKLAEKEYSDQKKRMGLPDLQMVGIQPLLPFGVSYSPDDAGDFISSYFSPSLDMIFALGEDNSVAVTKTSERYDRKWRVDGDIMMPDQYVVLLKDRGVTTKLYDELYDWTTKDGVTVIDSMFGEAVKSMKVEGEEHYKNYKILFDWRFGWRSINASSESLDFSPENYDSLPEIEKAVEEVEAYLKTIETRVD